MNTNQTFEVLDLHINDNDETWKESRLTCDDPRCDLEDPRFDFDSLQVDNEREEDTLYCENCELQFNDDTIIRSTNYGGICETCDLLLPRMTRCRCDDSKPDPYLTCCNCGFEEYEYYGYRYKSSSYCNECAFNVCGKLIEKPKYTFSRVPLRTGTFQCDFVYCDECNYMMLDEDKIMYNSNLLCSHCARDAELLDQYSEEQQEQLINYAEKHNLTIEESIDYQTHCHCCGKTVEDGLFDEMNHQYCKKRCFEHCEDYWYECFRGEECKVCEIWEYRARRDSLTAYDIELSDLAPVLNAIDCFKELGVYGELYECIEDLVEYFDSDRKWRYDYN